MFYEVKKKPKHIDIQDLDKCISFACDYLNIDIDFCLEFCILKEYVYGICTYDKDETIIQISKFLPLEDIIITIFHELVHVQQYASYRRNEIDNSTKWEEEAFEFEKIMLKDYYGSNKTST